jgi:pimeloyl-ACP methyl ester carboxylesterase
MSTFIMIHGAWHGGWCWDLVAPSLRAAGHAVYAPTLTGLAERKHLLSAQVTLATHISDVVNLIEHNDLRDIVLVAHSYGGIVGANVAAQCFKRIKHLVWVDAHIPHAGESWGDLLDKADVDKRIEDARLRGLGIAMPVPDTAAWGITPQSDAKLHAWVVQRLTPQPLSPLTDRAKFDEVKVWTLPKLYISCEQPQLASVNKSRDRAKASQHAGSWRVEVLQTGHDPMLTMPEELTAHLLSAIK